MKLVINEICYAKYKKHSNFVSELRSQLFLSFITYALSTLFTRTPIYPETALQDDS